MPLKDDKTDKTEYKWIKDVISYDRKVVKYYSPIYLMKSHINYVIPFRYKIAYVWWEWQLIQMGYIIM